MSEQLNRSRADIRDQSQPTDARQVQRLSLLAALAVAGQLCLLASAWLLPLVSEYSLLGDHISELVLGRYGWVQTAAFPAAGLSTLALAFVIRRLTVGTWGSFAGALLIAVYGAGALLAAIFPTDRIDSPADVWSMSTTGIVHSVVFLVSILCVIAGMFTLTVTFWKRAQWRSLAPWLALFPPGALALLLMQGEGPWVGLRQRMLITLVSVWQILVAIRAAQTARSTVA